jgi:hypothetical protein
MLSHHPLPHWLRQILRWGFILSLIGVMALAYALSQGLADPPRAGRLQWQSDFRSDAARWEFRAPAGSTLVPTAGGLLATFSAPEQLALGLTADPGGDFTLETGGTQIEGETGAAYGVVFGWQDETHYSAVLINSNGYAEAYRQAGAEKQVWFAWGQWPHILALPESNRVRIDVRGGRVTARVNDELLVENATTVEAIRGRVGIVARSLGAGKISFSWMRLWASK